MSYSWSDDRLNFTGHNSESAPSFTWKCKFYVLCEKSPFIWMPSFDYAAPNSVKKSISDNFMTIQKV